MRWTADGVQIGAVLGIPVLVQNSAFLLACYLPAWAFVSSSTSEVIARLILTPCFVASIFAHELGHALAARAFQMPVKDITLTWFGGFTSFWLPPTSRSREIAVALAGPAVNFGIAAIAFAVLLATSHPLALPRLETVAGFSTFNYRLHPTIAQSVIGGVFWMNLALALFNLLPGLPLDGGHVLRGLLNARMSRGRSGWIAAWAGVAIGATAAAYAIWIENISLLLISIFVTASAWSLKRRLRYD